MSVRLGQKVQTLSWPQLILDFINYPTINSYFLFGGDGCGAGLTPRSGTLTGPGLGLGPGLGFGLGLGLGPGLGFGPDLTPSCNKTFNGFLSINDSP